MANKFCRVGCEQCGHICDAFPLRDVTVNFFDAVTYSASWDCHKCGYPAAVSIDVDTAKLMIDNGAPKRNCQYTATATLMEEIEKFLGRSTK
jgi:hypothetical protein